MRVKPSLELSEYRQLRTTILTLGYEATLSWSTQSSIPPDTNVAHYPRLMYYYHPDYLGHVEYITDLDGLPPALSEVEVYQYFYYTAWGETLLEQKANRPGLNFDSPYRFNGKELDEETGLYYYGARYYNPTVSVWLGVDALSDKYPSWSPYNFDLNNPVNFVDPDGNAPGDPGNGPAVSAGLRIGGRNGRLFANLNLSVGLAFQNSSFQGVAYSSINIGLGQQLGTSSMAGANVDFQFGAFMAGGSGSAGAHPINTTNYNSPLPVSNTFKSSFGLGVSRNYSLALNSRGDGPGWQWGTFNNVRFGGDFSINNSNDGYLDLALGWTGATFDNFDAGNTGAISFHLGNEGQISFGYQQFTGGLLDGPRSGTGTYSQTPYQSSFNRANTFLQLGGFRMDYSGSPWLQDGLHHLIGNPTINHQNTNYGLFGISGLPY